jgi:hypothetical protein
MKAPKSGLNDPQDNKQLDSGATHSGHDLDQLNHEPECKRGTYRCTQPDRDAIEVCGADLKWTFAATCCGPETCNNPPVNPNVPYCTYCDANLSSPGSDGNATREVDTIEELDSRSLEISAPEAETTRSQHMTSVEPSAQCSPGTYQCRQPFTTGHLQVCNTEGVWQISNECCGAYTCYDPPGDEPARCECQPEHRRLEAIQPAAEEKLVNVPQNSGHLEQRDGCKPGTYSCNAPNTAPLVICNAFGSWAVSNDCCGLHTCRQGAQPGTAYCLC